MRLTRRGFLKLSVSALMACGVHPKIALGNQPVPPSKSMKDDYAKSIKPLVLRVFSTRATFWDYRNNPYVDYVRDEVIDELLNTGLCQFAGCSKVTDAWEFILSTYKHGDIIAIKPNLNALHMGYSKNICVTPQVLNSVIKSLLEDLKVPAKDIYVYDLCVSEGLIRQLLRYPVNCIGKAGGSLGDKLKLRLHIGLNTADPSCPITMGGIIKDSNGEVVNCFIPKVLAKADHLINIPVLKAHQFVLMSSAFKNHFGTVRFSNYNQYPVVLHGPSLQRSLVDIYLNKNIRNKTRLIIIDALFGAPLYGRKSYGRLPTRWDTFPGGADTPSSLFLAKDPVALESVIGDMVAAEQIRHNVELRPHDYLHLAFEKNLGIHEHCNQDGRYMHINYVEIQS